MPEKLTNYKEITAPTGPENWDFIPPYSLSYLPLPRVKRRTHFPHSEPLASIYPLSLSMAAGCQGQTEAFKPCIQESTFRTVLCYSLILHVHSTMTVCLSFYLLFSPLLLFLVGHMHSLVYLHVLIKMTVIKIIT